MFLDSRARPRAPSNHGQLDRTGDRCQHGDRQGNRPPARGRGPDCVRRFASQVPALDILVNNAGISLDGKTPDKETVDGFRRVYETNVFGVVAVTNAFLPVLRESAHPRIVNISSSTGSLTLAAERAAAGRAGGGFAAYIARDPISHRETIST
jgi:NAD(P)-dependent dehydrogenase (short-subunit alcohol dehydrogenase family)